jgi:hypothetical protein
MKDKIKYLAAQGSARVGQELHGSTAHPRIEYPGPLYHVINPGQSRGTSCRNTKKSKFSPLDRLLSRKHIGPAIAA